MVIIFEHGNDHQGLIVCVMCLTYRLFGHFDKDDNGHLTAVELKGLLLGLEIKRHDGAIPDDEEVQRWMEEFDVSMDGQISVQEFLQGIKKWMKISQGSFKKRSDHSSETSSPSEHQHHGWDFEAQVTVRP